MSKKPLGGVGVVLGAAHLLELTWNEREKREENQNINSGKVLHLNYSTVQFSLSRVPFFCTSSGTLFYSHWGWVDENPIVGIFSSIHTSKPYAMSLFF